MALCVGCLREMGRCTGESAVYSPNKKFILCEPCFLSEDDAIEEAGTNDLPDLLTLYKKNFSLIYRM